jgi:hypothetical protein
MSDRLAELETAVSWPGGLRTTFISGGRGRLSGRPSFVVAYAVIATLRDRRWPMKPSPTNPRAIMAQVDGSGTAATEKAFPSIELSADPAA